VLLGGPPCYSRPSSFVHSFYLYKVEGPEKYTEWFDIIRSCGENDIIKIHINSGGGDLLTTLQLIRALQETAATVVCSVEGQCCSAATLVFLQADMVEVSDHSIFMFHNYSGGTIGKGGEMMDQLKHESIWIEKLFRDVYKDFLTADEIQLMLNNKDIWMSGEEVLTRIKKKIEKLNESNKEDSVELVEEKPVKKVTKAKSTKAVTKKTEPKQ
jgi:ATP-dependent protease ClpP protease subunit